MRVRYAPRSCSGCSRVLLPLDPTHGVCRQRRPMSTNTPSSRPKAPSRNPFLSAEKYGTTHLDPSMPVVAPRSVFHVDLRTAPRITGGPVSFMQLASTSPEYMWGTTTGNVSYIDVANSGFRAVAQLRRRAPSPSRREARPRARATVHQHRSDREGDQGAGRRLDADRQQRLHVRRQGQRALCEHVGRLHSRLRPRRSGEAVGRDQGAPHARPVEGPREDGEHRQRGDEAVRRARRRHQPDVRRQARGVDVALADRGRPHVRRHAPHRRARPRGVRHERDGRRRNGRNLRRERHDDAQDRVDRCEAVDGRARWRMVVRLRRGPPTTEREVRPRHRLDADAHGLRRRSGQARRDHGWLGSDEGRRVLARRDSG